LTNLELWGCETGYGCPCTSSGTRPTEVGGLALSRDPLGYRSTPGRTSAGQRRKVVYGSPPDWNEMRAWERLLQPGELFIDVGANVGTYALWAAHLGCRVVAIEPDAETCRLLAENVALNPGARIVVRRTALTDHIGSIRMTTGLDSMNHLGDGPEVPATTLDAVIGDQDVAGVKIDVEGFEELVTRDGGST